MEDNKLRSRAVVCKLYPHEWAVLDEIAKINRRTIAAEIEIKLIEYVKEFNAENTANTTEVANG